MSSFEIVDWRALPRGSLLGFAKVHMPSGLIIGDVGIMSANGRFWASPPAKPLIDRDGIALRDDRGKIRYVPVIEFDEKANRDRWSTAVLTALRQSYPDAIPMAEAAGDVL